MNIGNYTVEIFGLFRCFPSMLIVRVLNLSDLSNYRKKKIRGEWND